MKLRWLATIILLTGVVFFGGCAERSTRESNKPASTAAFREDNDDGAQSSGSNRPTPVSLLDGQALADAHCVRCHSKDKWSTVEKTKEAWRKIVDEMLYLGASQWLSDDQAKTVVEYLANQNAPEMRAIAMPPKAEKQADEAQSKPEEAAATSTQKPAESVTGGDQAKSTPAEDAQVTQTSLPEESVVIQGAAQQAEQPTAAERTESTEISTPARQASTGAEIWAYVLSGFGVMGIGVMLRKKRSRSK